MITEFKIEKTIFKIETEVIGKNLMSIKSFQGIYTVEFVENTTEAFRIINPNANDFFFTDKNINQLYPKVNQLTKDYNSFSLEVGEEMKNIYKTLEIINELQHKNINKGDRFISIGGGIIQDHSAFVASMYKRGIDWHFIPTTLLSMADSCIGAKTALNHGEGKNQLGLFSGPKRIIISSEFLKTLDPQDILSGYGEILKLVITGGDFFIDKFRSIESSDKTLYEKLRDHIKISLNIKKAIIEEDEFELDVRRSLNYGHTIGHAIEPLVNYNIPHGIAVSLGMIIENIIAKNTGMLNEKLCQHYNDLINQFIPSQAWSLISKLDKELLLNNILKDKKVLRSSIKFAVPIKNNAFDILSIEKNELKDHYLEKSFNESIELYGVK